MHKSSLNGKDQSEMMLLGSISSIIHVFSDLLRSVHSKDDLDFKDPADILVWTSNSEFYKDLFDEELEEDH